MYSYAIIRLYSIASVFNCNNKNNILSTSFTLTLQKYTDERLKKIHDTLIGIKIIKLNAWDDVFLKKIQAARKKELKYLYKDAFFWTLMSKLKIH